MMIAYPQFKNISPLFDSSTPRHVESFRPIPTATRNRLQLRRRRPMQMSTSVSMVENPQEKCPVAKKSRIALESYRSPSKDISQTEESLNKNTVQGIIFPRHNQQDGARILATPEPTKPLTKIILDTPPPLRIRIRRTISPRLDFEISHLPDRYCHPMVEKRETTEDFLRCLETWQNCKVATRVDELIESPSEGPSIFVTERQGCPSLLQPVPNRPDRSHMGKFDSDRTFLFDRSILRRCRGVSGFKSVIRKGRSM